MMNVLGLSGLPVFQAGQASWQRPHSVQVKPSSRSFQRQVGDRLDAERRVLAPRGPSPAARRAAASLRSAMLGIAVAMWRCLLNGR